MPSKRETDGGSARPSSLRGLIILNALLLIVLGAVTFGPGAQAQFRGIGDYTMVAGTVEGTDAAAVYIADTFHQELIVVTYNDNTRILDPVAYRNIGADAMRAARKN